MTNFYISCVKVVYSATQRVKSIAATCSSDFDVRFARAGNRLMIFAPRQRHGIAAVTRGTQKISTRIEFLRFRDCWIYSVTLGIQIIRRDDGDNAVTNRTFLCVLLEITRPQTHTSILLFKNISLKLLNLIKILIFCRCTRIIHGKKKKKKKKKNHIARVLFDPIAISFVLTFLINI